MQPAARLKPLRRIAGQRTPLILASILLAGLLAGVLYLFDQSKRRNEPSAETTHLEGIPETTLGDREADETEDGAPEKRLLDLVQIPWVGDLRGMLDRRLVRILTVPSETMYFLEKGTPRGIAAEFQSAFETFINKRFPPKARHLKTNVVIVPTRRDELLPGLLEGRGDIAASALTITPERERVVDFSTPVNREIDEIAVTGPASPEISALDDLVGKEVLVRRSSSYWESLERLNTRLSSEGKKPITLQPAPEELEDNDLMEMVNAGLAEIVVVDDYKAELWAQILPDIGLHPNIAINTGGQIGWMMRKESPLLKKTIDEFIESHKQGTSFGNTVIQRYLGSSAFVKRATAQEALQKFDRVDDLFRKYGEQYRLDYLLLMAQGYQESRLDHNARSRAGALGIMQLKPSTGKAMGVGDVRELEANIHAGTKYIRSLVDDQPADDTLDDLNKVLFAFAAYNLGPSRLNGLRDATAKRGLDPNIWFDNVELVVSDKVGSEPVTYVSNIFKYYVGFKLLVQHREARRSARGVLDQRTQQ